MRESGKIKFISSVQLKLIAMALMLCDHLWAVLIPGNRWLTDIGRLAFPIFAFQIAEGFFMSRDRRKYLKRLFIFALISELPFDLMYSGEIFFPFHQNVLFTFCIGVLMMDFIEKRRQRSRGAYIGASLIAAAGGFLAGSLLMTDYFGFGVLTVLIFYFARGMRPGRLFQLAGLILINFFMLSGMDIPFELFGREFFFPQQGFAVLALIPIWLYDSEKGAGRKELRRALYIFYPLHMLLIAGIRDLFL